MAFRGCAFSIPIGCGAGRWLRQASFPVACRSVPLRLMPGTRRWSGGRAEGGLRIPHDCRGKGMAGSARFIPNAARRGRRSRHPVLPSFVGEIDEERDRVPKAVDQQHDAQCACKNRRPKRRLQLGKWLPDAADERQLNQQRRVDAGPRRRLSRGNLPVFAPHCLFLNTMSGSWTATRVPAGTELVMNALPPMTEFAPITVSPPRMDALE